MAERRLRTLVHVSDLHLGVPRPCDGGRPPDFWRYTTWFDGMLGHDESSLKHLADYFLSLEGESPDLVVTGDLTSCGNAEEFALAKQFLEADIPLENRPAGMHHPRVLSQSIPGNHDHWPGMRVVWGGPPRALEDTWPPPMESTPLDLPGGRRLTLFRIDSDAQVFPYGPTRFFARGKFVDELKRLEAEDTIDKDEIRVLLVHHSPSLKGQAHLVMTDKSRKELWLRVQQCGVSVILTGHVHRPIGRVGAHWKDGWDVLEARCGTTTQTDEMPEEWIEEGKKPNPARFNQNTLLVHRLVEKGRTIEWQASVSVKGTEGFTKPIALTRPVRVWPR